MPMYVNPCNDNPSSKPVGFVAIEQDKETSESRCLYCSELANGLTSTGSPSCGDSHCGEIKTFFRKD